MEQQAQAMAHMMKMMMMGLGGFGKAFYQKYGDEALPIITEIMSRGGEEWGKVMQQMMPVKNMQAIGESLKMMGPMLDLNMEIVELSDDKLHFKMPRCPFGIEGTSRKLCEAMMNIDNKMVSTVLGKEADTKILKTVAGGDKECEVIHSVK